MTETDLKPDLWKVASPTATRAVALVLPGGKADSFEAMDSDGLATVRMRPFAKRLVRIDGTAVLGARYRYQGWNKQAASPVADVRWALEQIRGEYPSTPIVLIGHSMGGRLALRCAVDPDVAGVVALAPWLPENEPVEHLAGVKVVMAHGNLDFVTSARASLAFARRAAAAGAEIGRGKVLGDLHAMLFRAPRWNSLVVGGARLALDLPKIPRVVERLMVKGRNGELDVAI